VISRQQRYGSTLRKTLGVLLVEKSSLPLRRVGTGNRFTFTHEGEIWLDQWMDENAFVCWVEHPSPWKVEAEIFQSVSLPLNLQDNKHHPFASTLSELRRAAVKKASELPVADERDWTRRGRK
jgi:hypothetical protein